MKSDGKICETIGPDDTKDIFEKKTTSPSSSETTSADTKDILKNTTTRPSSSETTPESTKDIFQKKTTRLCGGTGLIALQDKEEKYYRQNFKQQSKGCDQSRQKEDVNNNERGREGSASMMENIAESIMEFPSPRDGEAALALPGAYALGCGLQQEGDRNVMTTTTNTAAETVPTPTTTSSDDNALVEATPIPHNSPRELHLEQARPVLDLEACHQTSDTENENQKKKKPLPIGPTIAVLVVVLVGVIVISLLVVFLGVSTDDDTLKGNPNESSELVKPVVVVTSPEDYLRGVLAQDNTLNSLLQNVSVHQHKSLQWLAEDPNLRDYPEERVIQRYALANLFHSSQGDSWVRNDNWLSYDHHECDWYAHDTFIVLGDIQTSDYPCNNETGLYERLWLSFNNLVGTVPEETYALTTLKSMDMLFNLGLHGTISTRIGNLQHLEKLSLVRTTMSGTIPSQMGFLSRMDILYLSKEDVPVKFHGAVPNLERLTSLKQLALDFNAFTGSLPEGIGGMTNLKLLGLQTNQFTGQIPNDESDWKDLTNLQYLYLHTNQLTGSTPSTLGLLSQVGTLHLYNNKLEGSIPSELGLASSVKELMVSNNTLTGTVPSELGLLTDAAFIFLSHNAKLTGSLPSEMLQLDKLTALDLSDTGIAFSDEMQDQLPINGSLSFEKYYGDCNRRHPCDEEQMAGVHQLRDN